MIWLMARMAVDLSKRASGFSRAVSICCKKDFRWVRD